MAWLFAPVSDLRAEPRADLGYTAPFLQDTTRARDRRPEKKLDERERPDSAAALAADSLAEQSNPFPSPDSIMQRLMERPGYRPVVYRGDTLQFSSSDRAIHIRQRANIERAGEELSADSVVYEGQTRFVTAYGKSKLINASGEEVDSEVGPLFYHTDRRIGTVMGGKTKWEVWNVEGDFTLEGTDTLWVRSGFFTSCDLPEPHYRFESDRIKLVLGRIVVAWPVRLYFGDVPVFWFPFIAQDIRRGRHSGLLTLGFGFNDIIRNSSDYNRHISNVGYYWAISDYTDAQFSMDWWSDNWTPRFDTYFRYRWRQKFLDGRIGLSQFFRPNGKEISGSWNHSQKFGERSDLRASVQFVSSQQFNRENEYNPERLTQNIRSNIGFSRRFDWGSLNLSAQRVQPLSDSATTTMTLPQLSLTLTPIVLTPARSPLEARWYSDLTWTGSTNFSRTLSQATGQPDQTSTNGSLTSNLTLGNLRWNSSANLRDQTTEFTRDIVSSEADQTLDTILVFGPSITQGDIAWRSSFGYQQRLVGSSTITPALNLDGRFFRSNASDLRYVSAPTRISVSASLNTDVYGFFPGFGSWERIRHKFSPAFSWSYSPEVKPSERLRELGFPTDSAAARHQITMTLSQTFEAKLKPRSREEEQPADSLAEGEAEPGAARDSVPAEQTPESRKITVMAIRTSALAYDFVTGKLITGQISNSLTSDLLRGLTVRFDHDLFDESDGRRFAPFLTQLNLSFSLGQRTVAGLFGEPSGGLGRGGIVPEPRGFDEQELGMLPEEERPGGVEPGGGEADRGARRPWSLSIDYSLVRQRPIPTRDPVPDRQSIRANLGFSPTQNWSLNWRTTFDVERSDFVDHTISLRRDLHRWSATFEFWQSANGNFVFNFRVNLNDLRDVKFDYRQETSG
ncbi:MAG: putative LPS assembly protein LptD [Gemmatimonadales bacterium]